MHFESLIVSYERIANKILNMQERNLSSVPENPDIPRRNASRRFPLCLEKKEKDKKSISRCKNTFLLSRFHWQSLRRDGICMIPENWTAPRLTRDIYSTVRSRRCTLVEKYMCPCPLRPFAFGIVYDSSAGVEGKLDYRRSNTESDQIAWKGLHPSSSSVRRSRPTNTHGAQTRSVQFFLLIAKFCISTISGRRYGSSFTLPSNCINAIKIMKFSSVTDLVIEVLPLRRIVSVFDRCWRSTDLGIWIIEIDFENA